MAADRKTSRAHDATVTVVDEPTTDWWVATHHPTGTIRQGLSRAVALEKLADAVEPEIDTDS